MEISRPNEKFQFNHFINQHIVNYKEKNDKLIWVASKDERYKVKLGDELIKNSQRWEVIEIPLDLCWDSACLPKACNFLWATLHNQILMGDRFLKLGFAGPSSCFLCKNDSKTIYHLLFNYPFTKKIWSWLL